MTNIRHDTHGHRPPFPITASPAYDPDTVDLLDRLIRVSLRHPHDPDALTGGELRGLRIPMRAHGYPTDPVDDWLDQIIPLLDDGEARENG